MREIFNPHVWGAASAVFVSQIPELTERKTIRKGECCRIKRQSRICEKFVCTDLKNGTSTTGISFPNGKTFIGDDVWRLSNKADCCDYPYKKYQNRKLAEQDYQLKPITVVTFCTGVTERREMVCV